MRGGNIFVQSLRTLDAPPIGSSTFSDADKGTPISPGLNITQTTVPSQEHANRCKPLLLHDMSKTLSSKTSFITTKGLFSEVNHTLIDLSLEPMAQLQYCCAFGVDGLNFFNIFELNRLKKNNESLLDYLILTVVFKLLTTQVTALRCPTKSLSCFQPSLSIIWAVGPPPFMACAETRYIPSGDHDNLNTCVVAEQSVNASETTSCCVQSLVRHTLKVLSSDWLAIYFPTGSQVTP